MAHFEELKFIEITSMHINAEKSWKGYKVLEIGSHNVNGSVRPFFNGSEYIGVDLSEGEGVDVVSSGHEVDFQDKSIDVVISCECFEHNPEWVQTFKNMYRMTKEGGVIIVTCASKGRIEHGTTRSSPQTSPGTQVIGWDYYKNLNKTDFEEQFDLKGMFQEYIFAYNKNSQDLYFVGKKAGVSGRTFNLTLNSDILLKEVCSIKNPEHGILYSLAKCICRMPLKIAQVLPENRYQEFAIFWSSVEKSVGNIIFRK